MREHVGAVDDRCRLREEDVVQLLAEHRRAAARRLDEGVVVAVRDGCGGRGQQGRERPERERDLVVRDQVLVVRDDLRRARRVVDDLQLHLLALEAAVHVDHGGPELVAAHRGLAGIGEVSRERERDADLHRAGGCLPRGRRRGRCARERGGEDGRGRDELEGTSHRKNLPCRSIRPAEPRDVDTGRPQPVGVLPA